MSYYFLYHKKGIPSWIAYFLILILTVSLTFVFKNSSTQIVSRANKNLIPQSVAISNKTNESVSIFFTTHEQARTNLSYSSNLETPNIKFDARDDTKQNPRKLHYFQLNQLKKNSNYTFNIFVEGKKMSKEYTFKTLNIDFPTLNNAPIFGKVLLSNLKPAENVLVKVKILPYQNTYSALTKQTGEWVSTLPIIFDNNQKEVELDPTQVIELQFINQDLKKSNVRVKYQDSQPLRSIIMGQDYDFTTSDLVLGVKNQKTGSLISSPQNNSLINSNYPIFRGRAEKNTLLSLIIEPNIANLLITVDSNGAWKYSLPKPLLPETYSLTAKNNSKQQTINFTVGKSGESVLGDATPSATTTIEPTIVEPTPILATPTNQPTTTITSVTHLSPTPTPKTQIPELGFSNNLIILLASGLSLLGLYLVLY